MKLFPVALNFVLAAISVHAAITEAELKENAAKGLRLLSFAEGEDPVWKSQEEVFDLKRAHVRFFDVTEVYEPDAPTIASSKSFLAPAVTYPPPSHQRAVKDLIKTISVPNMQGYLSSLTSFNNRYFNSTNGAEATKYVVKTLEKISARYPACRVTVKTFRHNWPMSSVIAHIPGLRQGPVTILGAHLDSINVTDPLNSRAPGADDDGSGSVNLIETFRVLLASGFRPRTPVEFHWYSGEELGLLGSQDISKSYKAAGTQVKAMLQLDMTAYTKTGTTEVFGLLPDFVDTGLTSFIGSLIDTYSRIHWVTSPPCGFACSDHASWFKNGYPSAFPFETRFGEHNPNIHGSGDTVNVDGFSWSHSLEYAKLAVAFAYELGI